MHPIRVQAAQALRAVAGGQSLDVALTALHGDERDLGFARAEVATLRAVFDHVAVIAPLARLDGLTNGGNFVLAASDDPLPVDAIQARNTSRGDDDTVWSTDAELATFVGDAEVLTDEYAPVDQLITPEV